jgi:hypothetical protein
MSTSNTTFRIKPLTTDQKVTMIQLRNSGVPAEKVARKYRISTRSLATYMANHTRGVGATATV